ncbi:unnamed protein product [Rotaria socialis]|uniref:Uncharacterized protein n=1 Tax=Rotaria socialis TaxID=392032 RepID=A0A818W5Z5_9BILA|nr:unnamed protein product [Rotaria socialis]
MGTFNHIVASFQTPFWLQEKRWFPTRGYAFKSRTLELHTTTMHMPDTDNFFKVENLAESNTYCFVGEPPKCDREKTLRQLSLDGNKIEDDGAQHLAAALLSNTTLVSLDLRNNNLSDIGIGLIADTLRKNTTLSRIDLTGNPSNLCTVITIMQRMKCDMSLNNLKVQGCQVGNKGLQYLTDIFQYNKAIVTTNLDNNETDDNGVKHFAYVLRNNPESILWIRDSSIYDMFCGKTLTTLSLSSNRICDDGIKHLVDAIQNNTTLAALDLEGNQIEDREVKYLADLLRTSKTLITMNLQKNRIGVIDAEHLREALQMNTV